jgi:hypothetical protein
MVPGFGNRSHHLHQEITTVTNPQPKPASEQLRETVAQLEAQLAVCDEQDRQADAQLGAAYTALAAGDELPAWYQERHALISQRRHALGLAIKTAKADLAKAEDRERRQRHAEAVAAVKRLVEIDDKIAVEVGEHLGALCAALRRQVESRQQVGSAVRAMVGHGEPLTSEGYVELGLRDTLQPEHLYRLASIQLHGELPWWPYDLMPLQGGRPYTYALRAANALVLANFDDVVTYDPGEFNDRPKPAAATAWGAGA